MSGHETKTGAIHDIMPEAEVPQISSLKQIKIHF